jgi:hypothetical protein
MLTEVSRELWLFARDNGYEATACPDCAGTADDVPSCANCGGSGRLWTSTRGSLSDAGLERLRGLVCSGR